MTIDRLLLTVLLSGLSFLPTAVLAQTAGAPGGKAPPKLVLFLVVDGFPQEQLVKYYDQYGERGFRTFLDRGAWYGNNHYSHATTYTSVGHATLLSCAHPYKHGVVGNDWIDKKTGKRIYSTEDARHKYIGEDTPQHSGTSPFNIKVTAVGDELIYANGKSKVITISGKDRSAIGLAGQHGTAYMHSTVTGRFITSDYYMPDYPGWWKAFYEGKPQDRYSRQKLGPLLLEEPCARSTSDDRPWTTRYKGFSSGFPHATARQYHDAQQGVPDAMMSTPWVTCSPSTSSRRPSRPRTSATMRPSAPDVLSDQLDQLTHYVDAPVETRKPAIWHNQSDASWTACSVSSSPSWTTDQVEKY